jgi:hypothetical protein
MVPFMELITLSRRHETVVQRNKLYFLLFKAGGETVKEISLDISDIDDARVPETGGAVMQAVALHASTGRPIPAESDGRGSNRRSNCWRNGKRDLIRRRGFLT